MSTEKLIDSIVARSSKMPLRIFIIIVVIKVKKWLYNPLKT